MSDKIKEVDIKTRIIFLMIFFFRNLDPNKSRKMKSLIFFFINIFIYHIGYVPVKDLSYATIDSVTTYYQ